jgi:UDP-glucose 4-epimerase
MPGVVDRAREPGGLRALITGGGGFIGAHLGRRLADEGWELDLVDNLSRGVRDSDLEQLLARPGVRLFEADLLDATALEGLTADYDVIFHLAAIVGVSNVLNAPYRVLDENVVLCANLLRFASAGKPAPRFMFASTSEVYAGTLERFGLEIPTPESAPLTLPDLALPRSSYLLSKIYGEALCHQSGVPFTVIRPHNVYGPRMGMSHVIPELLARAATTVEGELEVFSMAHRRTFCFVDDAVAIVAAAALAPECAGEVINVGTQEPEVSIEELAHVVLDTVGRDLKLRAGPTHPGSPERRAPDTAKADRLTGQVSRVGLREGLARTYEWYAASGQLDAT